MLTCGDSLGSMAEVASLTSELDTLRGKKSPGTIVNLLSYFPSLSNELDDSDKGEKGMYRGHLV